MSKTEPEKLRLISRSTLAGLWECSISKLKCMEKAGGLPHIKIGKTVRYNIEDIERIEREGAVSR